MLKHVVLIILLSTLVVIGAAYFSQGIHWLLSIHDWIAAKLMDVFSTGTMGHVIRNLLALLCIPLIVGLIPLSIYWFIKRRAFPYLMEFIWIIWFIQASAIVVLNKMS